MATVFHEKVKDIVLDNYKVSRHYQMEISTLLVSNEDQVTNEITADVTKTLLKKDDGGAFFSVEVKNRKQPYLEGNALIENELTKLQEKLVVYCTNQGVITSIVNRGQIKEDWHFQKKRIKKAYKGEIEDIDLILEGTDLLLDDRAALLRLISESEIMTLLFPPIYNQELLERKTLDHDKVFSQFFDEYDLPLTIKTTLLDHKEAVNNQIIRSGSLNNYEFELAEVKRFFRRLYNAQDLAIDIDVAYVETFDLDIDDNVYAGTQMMGVEIDQLYRYRKISKFKKVTNV